LHVILFPTEAFGNCFPEMPVTTNPAVEVLNTEVLSDNWYVLRKVTFRLRKSDGSWETQSREAYDRGNGATILPYDPLRRTVILTRQFRLPTFVNGNDSGMLIETCAGLLDRENPAECITRELREETGFELHNVRKVMEAYMSPGSVTEILYFFVAEYTPAQRAGAGGGVEEEDIETIELTLEAAQAMMASGEIRDGKTIMLLQYAALHLFGEPAATQAARGCSAAAR
jgi:nudix-type nucleoside diphosphatase (YffH/AdpP family)